MTKHVAVVSDTHGHVRFTEQAVSVLASRAVDLVLHGGDVGNLAIVSLFHRWPTHFVAGNVDRDTASLARAVEEAGQTFHGEFGDLELAGKRIALAHGHDSQRLREAIDGCEYDLVCHGHTHRRRWERVGRTWVLNPGAVFRANPRSIAFVELSTLSVEFLTL